MRILVAVLLAGMAATDGLRRPWWATKWLGLLHGNLDAAVFAASGCPEGIADEETLAKLLELNCERSGGAKPVKPRA